MKRLTCEMCGSNDLIKQDGVFVCQSCGCKYSVEEAKKLMIEGPVEVTGKIAIDNKEILSNLLKLGWQALEMNDNEKKEVVVEESEVSSEEVVKVRKNVFRNKNFTLVFGLHIHNKVISHIITGQNPQFLVIPFLFIFSFIKSLFFKIKEIIVIIIVYNISIKKVFLINIIIYFIVPNRVSKDDPSRVQKIRPKITFIMLVVINTEENKRQIWILYIV